MKKQYPAESRNALPVCSSADQPGLTPAVQRVVVVLVPCPYQSFPWWSWLPSDTLSATDFSSVNLSLKTSFALPPSFILRVTPEVTLTPPTYTSPMDFTGCPATR